MKKLIPVLIVFAFVFQSCSTGNMFGKKRYGHLKWIHHSSEPTINTAPEEAEKTVTPQSSDAKEIIRQENVITEEPALKDEPVKTHVISPGNKSSVKGPVDNEVNMEENTVAENALEEKKEEVAIQPDMLPGDTAEKSTGELLLMAVLIACIIILFLILDAALAGLLSLILIIFIILVLLRYLGVI